MKSAENLSVVCGTAACDADCPFCVSKMTGLEVVGFKPQEVNWRNFDKACQLAKDLHVGSVVITGKGEPILFPDQVSAYLEKLNDYKFPLVDLQTNGKKFMQRPEKYDDYLKKWYDLGLAFVALSVVHFLADKNKPVYSPREKEYIDLPALIDKVHNTGLSVRLSTTLIEGGIDSPELVYKMIDFAKLNGVEQLTLRKVASPIFSASDEVKNWTVGHKISDEKARAMGEFLEQSGHRISVNGHGGVVYDVGGQNVCYTNALTLDPLSNEIRQIIFFPSGRIQTDWQFNGSAIL